MDGGYVKLWRKSLHSRVFNNPELWQLWTWCLMRANHKKQFVLIKTGKGTTTVEVQPGEFVFGRKSCAKELNSNESSIRNRIKKLESFGNVVVKPDTHYSIVSICNWVDYQVDENKKGQPEDKQRTGKGQPKDTDKNEKKETCVRVVEYLNAKTGKNYKTTTDATIQLITARLKEGFAPEDFKTVIDNQCREWLNDPGMEKYLRPATLFMASKFDGYLQNTKATATGAYY